MRISFDTVLLPVVLTVLAACGTSMSSIAEPPPLIHGGWIRDSIEELPSEAAPESVRPLRPVKVWRVKYRGPQDISGIWILYPGATVAFEAMQRINKNSTIRPFNRGSFFIVLEAAGVPAQALGDFQEGVGKAIH